MDWRRRVWCLAVCGAAGCANLAGLTAGERDAGTDGAAGEAGLSDSKPDGYDATDGMDMQADSALTDARDAAADAAQPVADSGVGMDVVQTDSALADAGDAAADAAHPVADSGTGMDVQTDSASAGATDADSGVVPETVTIGGTLSGLAMGSVTLQDNGGDNLTLNANGMFTFVTPLPSGQTYSVQVHTNPAAQACVVTAGQGTVPSVAVTTIQVTCTAFSAVAVAAGVDSACAVMSSGTVECWGGNFNGELGNGTLTGSDAPVPTIGLTGVTAVAVAGESGVNGEHGCALLSGGTVECWGGNASGQLGNGTTVNSSTPVPVSGLTGVTALAAGAAFNCALSSGGTVECWGYNADGELGNGGVVSSATPLPVPGLRSVSALAAGNNHACALLQNGSIECWGSNAYNQIGIGVGASTTPVPVTGLGGSAIAVTAGGAFTCALLSGGTVDCWGYNYNGQLGNGALSPGQGPPGPVLGLSGATALQTGNSHTCALLPAGAVECWGVNVDGQLGNGTTAADSDVPVLVSGLSGVTALAAGASSTCALLPDATIDCWGYNASGQLGNGTTANSDTPVPVW